MIPAGCQVVVQLQYDRVKEAIFSLRGSLIKACGLLFSVTEVKKLKEFRQKSVYAHNHRPYLDSQMYSSQSGHLEAGPAKRGHLAEVNVLSETGLVLPK